MIIIKILAMWTMVSFAFALAIGPAFARRVKSQLDEER